MRVRCGRHGKGKKMNILVACKVVYDDQYIRETADGQLDFSAAQQTVSTYDLNAVEAASQLAAQEPGSRVVALSVGSAGVDDSKTKKEIIAHGVDELFMTADDACADMDSFATAAELANLVRAAGEWDVILCGDGSNDLNSKQVGVQLADRLGVPYLSGVVGIERAEGADWLGCKRLAQGCVETVEVPLPAVLACDPGIAQPRICSVRDIMMAGRKPQTVLPARDEHTRTVQLVEVRAPQRVERECRVFDAGVAGDLRRFCEAVCELV